jgi:hypothetical protein
MGASFEMVRIKSSNIEGALSHFKDIQSSLLVEYGCDSYAGHLGIKEGIEYKGHFDTEEQAEEMLNKNGKWSPAFLVSYGKIKPDLKTSEKIKLLQSELAKLSLAVESLKKEITTRIKNQKSQLKGCSCCGSKISVKHLKSSDCPVCNSSLLTDTDKLKIEKLKESVAQKTQKIKSEIDKLEKGKIVTFLAGGWCSS